MAPFPSISPTLEYFEGPDPAKLAAEEKAHSNALKERLHIPNSYGPSKASSPPNEAGSLQAFRPEVPPRPARSRTARERPSTPETNFPPTPQDSIITVSSRHRDPPTSEADITALRTEISCIKAEVQCLKEQLEIRNEEFEVSNRKLRDMERKYEEAIVDMRKSKEEKQVLEDTVERLRRHLDRTRSAKELAEAQLATRQRDVFAASEMLREVEERRAEERRAEERRAEERRAEERRAEEARRVEARGREDETRADVIRRAEEEVARRMTEQRLNEEARREGRREGRRERRSRLTLLVNERPRSTMAWSLFTGRTTRS